jgi:hypothetical protein
LFLLLRDVRRAYPAIPDRRRCFEQQTSAPGVI